MKKIFLAITSLLLSTPLLANNALNGIGGAIEMMIYVGSISVIAFILLGGLIKYRMAKERKTVDFWIGMRNAFLIVLGIGLFAYLVIVNG